MMGNDERECVKVPFGEYLKVPENIKPWTKVQGFFVGIFNYFVMSLATCTPLADAWDREWVMPLPSPMIYRPG